MAVRPIVQRGAGPDAGVLLSEAAPVAVIDQFVLDVVRDLQDTLHAHKIAVGLAAPQIGTPLRIAVINLKTEGEADIVLINPEIVSTSGKQDKKKESCMSLRNKRGDVIRRSKLEARYLDMSGTERTISATGFLARVLAHEIDHLGGVLYDKRMAPNANLETVDFDDWERKSTGGPS